jgi:Tol biopolymer transport system component
MVPELLAHYRIIRPIGAGGMGEVFLAEDEKLGRRIALKVLAPAMAADPERRARFDREARAVAALNHPNIITIYSVEEQDGLLFMTMELIEGKTLSDLIPARGLPIERFLELSIPLADAVGAAHQRGITHRDLKPANVMVDDEGRLKVLDFGLARLQEESPANGLSALMTKDSFTGEGRIVGTVAYMSPEQAQGKPVDARSDVFSLGILLFEMATGDKPFKGDTHMSVLSAIIKDAPASVTDMRQDLPREVGRILKRCLAKDPEDRFQTAKELRNDLRLFAREVGTGAAGGDQTSRVSQTGVLSAPARPRSVAMPLALGVIAALAVGGGWWYARSPTTTRAPAFSTVRVRGLTNTGKARIAAISPDGRYVVHDDGNFDTSALWMRLVSTASGVQIAPPTAGQYDALAFSPDGDAVLYVFSTRTGETASLFRIPVLGGPPRKLLDDISTAPAFSPDGKRMAFIRPMAAGARAIVLANPDGTSQRALATRAGSDTYEDTGLAWSPDGTQIAAFAGEMPAQRARIVLVNVETGREQEFSDARFDSGGTLNWLADGSALVFAAIEKYGGRWNWNSQIWSVAYPAGTSRRINQDLASYENVAATAGGRTLVAVRNEIRVRLWIAPAEDTARARPITDTSTGNEGATGVDWTADGRIVYTAITQNSWDIWIANRDGSEPKQLTSDPGVENQPQVLPTGAGIVFTSRESGADVVRVRTMNLDGTNPGVIDTGGGIHRGYVQAIGDHIYFRVQETTGTAAYRVPLRGGPREPLFTDPGRVPAGFFLRSVSPDGRWALGSYGSGLGSGLAAVPIGGNGAVRTFPYTYTPGEGFGSTWAPGVPVNAFEDLVFRDGATNLWRFPLDGSAPHPITAFTSEHILAYRWSPDGKTLALSRGTISNDIVLITGDDH